MTLVVQENTISSRLVSGSLSRARPSSLESLGTRLGGATEVISNGFIIRPLSGISLC